MAVRTYLWVVSGIMNHASICSPTHNWWKSDRKKNGQYTHNLMTALMNWDCINTQIPPNEQNFVLSRGIHTMFKINHPCHCVIEHVQKKYMINWVPQFSSQLHPQHNINRRLRISRLVSLWTSRLYHCESPTAVRVNTEYQNWRGLMKQW